MIRIYSKIELNENIKEELEKSLEKYLGRKVEEISYEVDNKIIAGLKIELDSVVLDLTLNNRLEKIIRIIKDNA